MTKQVETPEGLKHIHRVCKFENRSLAGPFAADLIERIWSLDAALRLYAKYAPFSGDMALMIRASQAGGQEAAERADKLVEHYSHLDEAHDAAREALNRATRSAL